MQDLHWNEVLQHPYTARVTLGGFFFCKVQTARYKKHLTCCQIRLQKLSYSLWPDLTGYFQLFI